MHASSAPCEAVVARRKAFCAALLQTASAFAGLIEGEQLLGVVQGVVDDGLLPYLQSLLAEPYEAAAYLASFVGAVGADWYQADELRGLRAYVDALLDKVATCPPPGADQGEKARILGGLMAALEPVGADMEVLKLQAML